MKQKTKQFEKVSNDLTFYQKCKEELEVDLQIEKNWRTQLQAELASQKEMIRKLNEEVALLNVFKDENIKYDLLLIKIACFKINDLFHVSVDLRSNHRI